MWLAPVQVSIIPVASEHAGYAQKVADTLRQARVRVDVDARNETLGMRVRVAHAVRARVDADLPTNAGS